VVIQVGVAENVAQPGDNELRAKIISERSILVPRVSLALEARAGRATPLAHGLELAASRLQHALQHGRSTIGKVTLVVVSDGRGNVPLAASHTGEFPAEIISRKGIEDALEIAQQISRMKRVETVILNPATEYYPELPYLLGDALNALEVVPLPTEDRGEVETNE
jgi:magnesium chelatase subunit D